MHRLMTDLRSGRITAEQFRAAMRESRNADPAAHERAKFSAIAHDCK